MSITITIKVSCSFPTASSDSPGCEMQQKLPLLLVLLLLGCAYIPVFVSAAPATGPESGFIVVASAPAADFYTATQVGTTPFRVSFFDRSEGSLPLGHLWNFGDGTTSREQNPTHIYATNGRYTVTLTVTNSFGGDTKTLTGFIAVGDPPVPDFSASPSQGNIPLDCGIYWFDKRYREFLEMGFRGRFIC